MARKNRIEKGLGNLMANLKEEEKPTLFSFSEFLGKLADAPALCLRGPFQLFHDMIHHYIPPGVNEYPNDPESINYIHYDCGKLFVEDSDNPFFVDRLLANRLINVVDSLKEGVVRNRMLLFVGPPGSGKSTFLNNLLRKLELYTQLDQGAMYETVWHIDPEKFGFLQGRDIIETNVSAFNSFLRKHVPSVEERQPQVIPDQSIMIPCPSHDHPITQIPKQHRRELLASLIDDKDLRVHIFHHKEFEWVFNSSPCPICASIYKVLHQKLSPEDILDALRVRRFEFSRKLGEGVSVYNPADKINKKPFNNPELQRWIDAIFKTSDVVSYVYSHLAKTNNGVCVIMDAKSNNIERIKGLHGIISDGIHKVKNFEESINSLFIALINPEDIGVISDQKSFIDRTLRIPIPYIRDYNTEMQIYRDTFGGAIDEHFLPMVLTCFAKIIVASRLSKESKAMKQWIKNPKRYAKFCDDNLLLLKMEIYCGSIPFWLDDADVKKLDRDIRRGIIMEGDDEGRKGYSGRESLALFNRFYARHRNSKNLIGVKNIVDFFKAEGSGDKVGDDFLDALVNLYDYMVLQQVKESMFFYNKEQIGNEIRNYLFAINHETESEVVCPFTGDRMVLSELYFERIERQLLNPAATKKERESFRDDILKKYVAKTLHQVNSGTELGDTELYASLEKRYNQNLKQNVLEPFIKNDNFRRAIKDFGSKSYEKYDRRIIEEVDFLMKNLKFKFNYTEKGAKQICIYVIDKKLADSFQ